MQRRAERHERRVQHQAAIVVLVHERVQGRTPVDQHAQDLDGTRAVGSPVQRVLQQLPRLHVYPAVEQFFHVRRGAGRDGPGHGRQVEVAGLLVQVGTVIDQPERHFSVFNNNSKNEKESGTFSIF